MGGPDWYRPPAADAGPEADRNDAIAIHDESTVSFWPRAGARTVDAFVVMGLSYAVDALVVAVIERGVPFPRMMFSAVVLLLLGLPVSTFTNTLAEAVGGATLGKLVFGQRVRMIDGRRCTVGAALKRSILYPVDAFFFGMVAYGAMKRSGMNQRYGDMWADTVVVRTNAIPGESRFDQRALVGAIAALVASIVWDAVTDLELTF